MHASRQEGIKGRKEAKGKFIKESEIGSRKNWEWKIGNGATMGLCGAILAEQSACVFRRASQHTIQWAWGGEICSFPPQGRRTARVSKIRNREGEIGRERSQGRTATTPSTTNTLFRQGSGRAVIKSTTLRKPSSRGLFCFPAQGRETPNKGEKHRVTYL